ncbi:tRNA (adenosine(37)-N6)-threonylcarbamoyltransferase complex dimerization subunit type 1 TsaB [Pseudogemmobacter sp. W21_MBD1_M6]|uniref:tRNA (adenosine(37)-N6)-threonylcarbamoyltransferase complex dimerization subunit type 1 TsaB n=1 Tax=Pseudogemmobacter sp. W21_MBD1_M6 TaxID=3240271 RepID=UPI003F98D994
MPPETYVLGFDTSAAHCAAALLKDGSLVASCVEEMSKGQAERLMPLLEDVLADAGIGWADLAAIGVGTGPGNFTGIRISVSAARGLALSLGVPAVGVSVFDALALDLPQPVMASVDARRGQVYAQRIGGAGVSAPETALTSAFQGQPPATCVGHDSAALATAIGGTGVPPLFPLAEAIARLAHLRFATETKRPAPLYIRDADAAPPRDPAPVLLP